MRLRMLVKFYASTTLPGIGSHGQSEYVNNGEYAKKYGCEG